MPFIHPFLFWLGLGGISIPIIIHILNRRRFKILDFAAMKFLLEAMRKNRRRLQLEQLILLLLRCLIVLLMGMALARFTGCGAMDDIGIGNERKTQVFLLDDSCSMGHVRGPDMGFRQAVGDLKERIRKIQPHDRVAILLSSESDEDKHFFGPDEISDPDALCGKLDELKPGDTRNSLSDQLKKAVDIFEDEDESTSRTLYVMSDFRRVDLLDEGDRKLQKYFAGLDEDGVRTVILDYGGSCRRNLTIERIESTSQFSVVDRATEMIITVRNNGTETVRDVPVELMVSYRDRDKVETASLPPVTIEAIEPGAAIRKEFSYTPEKAGFRMISASLPADELKGDNSAYLCLHVRGSTRVLLVDGKPDSIRPKKAESYLLRTALDPNDRGDWGFRVEVSTRDILSSTNFNDYDVVCLLNVPDFPGGGDGGDAYPLVTKLEKYVRRGGGLLIFSGSRLDPDFYNGRLYMEGKGLNPLPIRAMRGNPGMMDEAFRIDPKTVRATGPMSCFSGGKDSGRAGLSQMIRFFAFTPTGDRAMGTGDSSLGPVEIEACFNDRDASPAVVSRKFGDGQIIMIYSTASTAWNDWGDDDPQGIFVVPMAMILEYLSRAPRNGFTELVGSDIVYIPGGDEPPVRAILKPPGLSDNPIVLQPIRQEKSLETKLVCRNPKDAGIYWMTVEGSDGNDEMVVFTRNVDPEEGKLESAIRNDIASIFGRLDFTYIDRAEGAGTGADEPKTKKPYWMWMIAGLLVLLAFETFLSQRFGHWK